MLISHRRPVCLSLISTDLPILSTLETSGTIYPKDRQSFHLVLHDPLALSLKEETPHPNDAHPLMWLEITPCRVNLTHQDRAHLSYRHLWEKGVYGVSRYWLNDNGDVPQDLPKDLSQDLPQNLSNHQRSHRSNPEIKLRNYTRNLKLVGVPLLEYLRVEYELWSGKMQLGHYVLHLEIYH
jgi:hypothetical protein